eukprot:CAMPEP_0118799164 /NCGR_PEP_ID=MMETSP1161-20130426/1449_1 /TAXON_ID=249345 /ORGANISM="Picochlorum oklahomensis, Strain CCMP2329" /LENGTH=391 /DNA_ID=CAMNT_0006726811 /DNA_START=541 /DNA_END=1716 /DNA_ORIENTATION=-
MEQKSSDNQEKASLVGYTCARCSKPATLQCPKCLELKLEQDFSTFCSQECFKEAWQEHKKIHRPGDHAWHYCVRRGEGRSLYRPEFQWTGPLRPYRIGPTREIPDSIPKPDYYNDGIPRSEMRSKQQKVVAIRQGDEEAGIREACRMGRLVLDRAHAVIEPGITTDYIDEVVHNACIEFGAYPSPYNYFNFPKSVCTSVNEVICHGIPDRRKLENGDIVNVDVTVYYNGWHGDLNETFVVGEASESTKLLVKTTYECLHKAIEACKPGTRYRDIGSIISKHAHSKGFGVVKSYCGHGIGDLFHCAPNVPHYAHNKAKGIMKVGEVFTIEPMINEGSHRDKTWPDGWTSVTEDGKKSAQFEHQIIITENGCDILTKRLDSSPPFSWQEDGTE